MRRKQDHTRLQDFVPLEGTLTYPLGENVTYEGDPGEESQPLAETPTCLLSAVQTSNWWESWRFSGTLEWVETEEALREEGSRKRY